MAQANGVGMVIGRMAAAAHKVTAMITARAIDRALAGGGVRRSARYRRTVAAVNSDRACAL